MTDKIFVISQDGGLQPMVEAEYEQELDLQKLLENYVDLLPGEQIDGDSPRRWLLICRESSIADSRDGGGRWAADHLFVDQDAIPTIVETKRGSNTQLRREVIGQMLEYAANATLNWSVEQLRADFARTREERKASPETVLLEFVQAKPIGTAASAEGFWDTVKNNLAAQRVRLILVADIIPSETKVIIEFLNGQMEETEISAVEIRQYKGPQGKALVPRVIGQTAKATQAKKAHLPSKRWDENLILSETERECGSAIARTAAELMDWAKNRGDRTRVTGGSQWGRFFAEIDADGQMVAPFCINSTGQLQYCFGDLTANVFTTAEAQKELLDRVNGIPGNKFPNEKLTKYPWTELENLLPPGAMPKFKEVFEWVFQRCQTKRP